MIELFPEGFEEVDYDGDLELAAYAGPGAEERFWQVFGPGAARFASDGCGWGRHGRSPIRTPFPS